ncbi:Thiol-disulfide isomerase or thioredoxin [Gracilibacillus ureilyticus]|uniref:Thiol-disulfide isomerase or thioredoxin n=1 Tax=Gracilibacillus ureilyticus TaxID=531814 RepID=A0A1H9LDM6_9BACI|nr:redoxin domain-containing protein [Gracilibacillus ureilyticus]SER09536.1 Thiol-disulfide isomerase or thioredoxin [Gracilibacillus ureilyticus]
MAKNIIAGIIIIALIGTVIYTNFPTLFDQATKTGPNEYDVTGDTSVEGGFITPPNQELLKEGMEAPNLLLKNLQGEEYNLTQIEKDFVFVNFWATWCKPCIEEMPDLERLEQSYPDLLQVLAINATSMDNGISAVEKFLDSGQYDLEILLDTEGEAYDKYTVINIPTTFIIRQSDQQVIKRINGIMTYEQMEQHVNELKKID